MVDRIEIAKRFIQEQLQGRDDIVGAFVVGSVARGEDIESSDVDLTLIVDGDEAGSQWDRIDTWIGGVYVDAATTPKKRFEHLEQILQAPITATHMNDCLILYDPTGFISQTQKEVRAAFMQSKWLGIRVQFGLGRARNAIPGLQEAIIEEDVIGICSQAEGILWGFASTPLLRVGITPSSMRTLVQLGKISRALTDRICDLEGSEKMSPNDVLSLLPVLSESESLIDTSGLGRLPEYAIKKIKWLLKEGLHREALHTMWIGMSLYARQWRKRENLSVDSKESNLVQKWLRGVGWNEKEVLLEKLELAKSIFEEMEELASDLPNVTSSGT